MAPMEVAIVGDMKLDDVMPLIEKYIGSLPQRTRSAGHLDGLRKLARPTGPLAKHIEVETMTPQAMGIAGFSGCQGQNTDDRRALSLAQQILSSRLVKRVREELGMVYSIRASNSPSWAYEDAGVFLAAAPCDPNKAQQLTDEVHNMFSEFASKGPDGEELKNAKAQIAERLDTSMREPSFWLRLLQHHDLHRRNYNDTKDVKQAYEGMTADQVKSVFQKYYKPTRLFRLTAVPVAEKASDQKMGEQKKPKPTPAS
ncbi:MAG: M16 family metallopeptidase, partial [Phycisphaerae bacterium]